MLKILPALEGYVLANIATQALFDTGPLEFLLGDLNPAGPAQGTALGNLMGPNHSGISLKELLTGTMSTSTFHRTGVKGGTYTTGTSTAVLATVQDNFTRNLPNIIVGTALSTAGFRIAKKVLRKPISMANKSLRQMGLGSTVQF